MTTLHDDIRKLCGRLARETDEKKRQSLIQELRKLLRQEQQKIKADIKGRRYPPEL